MAVEVGIGPHVLAHRNPNLEASKVHRAYVDSGLEVARLVKDVVGGEQALAVAVHHLTAVAHGNRVVQRLAGARVVTVHKAHQDPEMIIREAGDVLQLFEVAADKVRSFEEIAGRITGRRELGEDHEVHILLSCLRHGRSHGLEIGVEGANRVVKLGDGDAHQEILPWDKDIPSSGRRP